MKTNLSRNPNVYKQLAQDCARLKLTEPQRQRQQWKASGLLQSLNLAEEATKGQGLGFCRSQSSSKSDTE